MSRYVILTVYIFVSGCKQKSVLYMSTDIFLRLHMKLLEAEDAVYQRMATYSEKDGQ